MWVTLLVSSLVGFALHCSGEATLFECKGCVSSRWLGSFCRGIRSECERLKEEESLEAPPIVHSAKANKAEGRSPYGSLNPSNTGFSSVVIVIGFLLSIVVAPLVQNIWTFQRNKREDNLRLRWRGCESDMAAYLKRCCEWAESNPKQPMEPLWGTKSARELLEDRPMALSVEEHEQGLLLVELVGIAHAICCSLVCTAQDSVVSIPTLLKNHPVMRCLLNCLRSNWDERMRILKEAFSVSSPDVNELRNLLENAQQESNRFVVFLPDLTLDDHWNRLQKLEQVPLRSSSIPLLVGSAHEEQNRILMLHHNGSKTQEDDMSDDVEIMQSISPSQNAHTTELVTALREQTEIQRSELSFGMMKFGFELQERRRERTRKEEFQRKQDRLRAQERDERLKVKLGAVKELHAEKQLQKEYDRMAVRAQSLGNALLFCCIGMVIYFDLQSVWNTFWEERPAYVVPLRLFSFPIPFHIIRTVQVLLGILVLLLCLQVLSRLPGWIIAPVVVLCTFWLAWSMVPNFKAQVMIACLSWAAPQVLLSILGAKHLRVLYIGWLVISLVLLGIMFLLCQ